MLSLVIVSVGMFGSWNHLVHANHYMQRYCKMLLKPYSSEEESMNKRHRNCSLQSLNGCFSSSQSSLASLDLAAVDLDHAGSAVSLLAIDRNLDSGTPSNDRDLLTHDSSLDRLAIHRYIFIVVGSTGETFVFSCSHILIRQGALEGISQTVKIGIKPRIGSWGNMESLHRGGSEGCKSDQTENSAADHGVICFSLSLQVAVL